MLREVFSKHDGMVMLIDSDMFLISPTSVISMMQNYLIGAVLQKRHNEWIYLWNGVLLLDVPRIPDFDMLDFGLWSGADTGAATGFFLQKHPEVPILSISTMSTPTEDTYLALPPGISQIFRYDRSAFNNWAELLLVLSYKQIFNSIFQNSKIYHYRSGSAWNPDQSFDFHKSRSRSMTHWLLTYFLSEDDLAMESNRCATAMALPGTIFCC